MRKRLLAAVIVLAGVWALTPMAQAADTADGGKIRVLILCGDTPPARKKTSATLRKIYEESGRFTVEVCEKVPDLKGADFANYDVVVSDVTEGAGHRWPAETEKAFLDYIAAGHGFVTYYADNQAWTDWPDYADLVGVENKGNHSYSQSAPVTLTDKEHPITRGMKDFQHVPEEIRRGHLPVRPTAKVLATVLCGQTHKEIPALVVTERGKGRTFYCALGYPASMHGIGFQTLMLRGTEWAAAGRVTIPIPANWPALGSPQAEEIKKAAPPVPRQPATKAEKPTQAE